MSSENQPDTMALCVVTGGILGWAIGVAQLVIMGSWDLFYWTYMPLIPFTSAVGWASYGMIIAGSGMFSKSTAAHAHSEKETPRTKAQAA